MAKTKDDWRDEAIALGIDVDELGEDGKEPTIPQLQDAIEAVTQELPVDADLFLAHEPTLRVPFAGLLAAEPHLQDQELKPSQWRAELKTYLDSPRP